MLLTPVTDTAPADPPVPPPPPELKLNDGRYDIDVTDRPPLKVMPPAPPPPPMLCARMPAELTPSVEIYMAVAPDPRVSVTVTASASPPPAPVFPVAPKDRPVENFFSVRLNEKEPVIFVPPAPPPPPTLWARMPWE